MNVQQFAAQFGINETSAKLWIEQMRIRVPALMKSEGLTIEQAVAKANEEYRNLLIEIAIGKSPRARVTRSYLAAVTYADFNGYEDPKAYALAEVLKDESLSDLAVEDIERSAASMF